MRRLRPRATIGSLVNGRRRDDDHPRCGLHVSEPQANSGSCRDLAQLMRIFHGHRHVPRTSDRRRRLHEVDVQALDAARLEPLIGLERMARYEAVAEATQAALRRPRRAQRQLDRDGRRRRRDAADAARLRPRRGHRRPLARDRGRSRPSSRSRSGSTTGSTARPATAETWAMRSGGTTRTRCAATPTSSSPSSGPATSCSSTIPQPAGLAAAAKRAGAQVVWRCHVGADEPNEWTTRAWDFLRPYLERGRRVRLLARVVRAAVGRDRRAARDPAVDRPVLGEERADVAAQRPPGARLRRPARRRRASRRSCRSPAATAHRAASTAASTSCRPGPPRRPTRRSSCRCRAGTA